MNTGNDDVHIQAVFPFSATRRVQNIAIRDPW